VDLDGDQGDRLGIGLLKGARPGFVAQVDGDDLRHPCPGARGVHLASAGKHGGAAIPSRCASPVRAGRGRKQRWAADVWGPLGGDSRKW
jgi:hypothetical protein